MKPSVSIWTTSQYPFDQRIQRVAAVMDSLGAEVTVWDRWTEKYPEGKIKPMVAKGPGFYLDYNLRIFQLARKHKTGLIYAADIDVMPGLMWALGPSKKIPLLLDLHEWFPEVIELKGKPVKRRIWQWIESQGVAFASAHMTVNHSLKYIFEEKYRKEFTVVRNVPEIVPGIEVDPGIRLDNKVLYYQGALNEGRGLETAIGSLHLLPGWRLWLAGVGDSSEKLKTKVEIEGLDDRVVFYGRKLPEELPDLAAQATLGLNLLNGQSKSYYYSLANKYFDYIYAGLPSIHMNFPEYRNLMQEYKVGGLLSDLSPRALADVVKQITSNNRQYISMVEQCTSAKNLYNWREESKVLVELVRRLLVISY